MGNESNELEKSSSTVPMNYDENEGAFVQSLQRNNRQIKLDRAMAIAEDAQIIYKRKIEDLDITIKKLIREQDNMLDLSPEHTQSLILASDFDSIAYTDKDIELGVKIRTLTIMRGIAKKRYDYLFGGV